MNSWDTHTLDLSSNTAGNIWIRPQDISPTRHKLMFSVVRDKISGRLTKAAFNDSDERFALTSSHGDVYLIDITKNTFRLVRRCGILVTAVSLHLHSPSGSEKIMLALADFRFQCVDLVTDKTAETITRHSSPITRLSVNLEEGRFLTVSRDGCYLWDLSRFVELARLNVEEGNVEHGLIVDAMYDIEWSNILVCLPSDLFVWNSRELAEARQLTSALSENVFSDVTCIACRSGECYAVTRSGRILRFELEGFRIKNSVLLPETFGTGKQMEFVSTRSTSGYNNMLALLSRSGSLVLVDIRSWNIVLSVGTKRNRIKEFRLSSNSAILVCVMVEGGVHVYDFNKLISSCANSDSQAILAKPGVSDVVVTPVGSAKSGLQKASEDRLRCDYESNKEVKPRLVRFLKDNNEFPDKYRKVAWRYFLQLPENYFAFQQLLERGVHPKCELMKTKCSDKDLDQTFKRILSLLFNWNPTLEYVDYLPALVLPFVRVYANSEMDCFEIILSILLNYCRSWFEVISSGPVAAVMNRVEAQIKNSDPDLYKHFCSCGITSQVYAWAVVRVLFSNVVSSRDWLTVIDHVICNPVQFLLCLVASFSLVSREALLSLRTDREFSFYFNNKSTVDVRAVIQRAYQLLKQIKKAGEKVEEYTPLPKGYYPVVDLLFHYSEPNDDRHLMPSQYRGDLDVLTKVLGSREAEFTVNTQPLRLDHEIEESRARLDELNFRELLQKPEKDATRDNITRQLLELRKSVCNQMVPSSDKAESSPVKRSSRVKFNV